MSLPSQVNTDKSKHQTPAMKEAVQHSGEVYFGMGPPVLKTSHSDSAGGSGVGHQSLPHYQQAAPVKWIQDPIQAPGWSQEAPMPTWGQNFGPYMSGVRDQMTFHKGGHEGVAMPMGRENQLPAPVEAYRDATQAQTQGGGLEWGQHAATVAAMHQAQLQAYQHGQGQPHTVQAPVLQPFQASFRPSKFSSNYYSVFPGNKPVVYSEQPKPQQQQLLHPVQQQQMHHHQQQQQQQQHMHQLQLQQQQQQQQHMQQQQIQQQQMQQQQLQQMQQQYHQQQLQEQQQQIQQQQQMQQQNILQQETTQSQVQLKQQSQTFGAFQPPDLLPPDSGAKNDDAQSVEPQAQLKAQTGNASALPDQDAEIAATNPADSAASAAPRRSRRLSREGQSPLGPPSTNIWSQASKEPPPSQNGVTGVPAARGGENQAATGGVIQITRRRRRASKEINLETLAQKASEMESLPAKTVKEDGPSSKQASIVPLVIPVSVPVQKNPTESQGVWVHGRLGQSDRPAGQTDRKPSVIVARRRSLKHTLTATFGQDEKNDPGLDDDGKSKFKRRTRPEPLIIPLPKPSTFIPPSVYSSITSYQSNLRSPVRMPDNPYSHPPYTPPPILSPRRVGSGLYFSTVLTNNQIQPPLATPKSATRSLLRSTSSDVTPPVLPLIADATPVCLEPRINIGQQYQAEIPDLRDQLSSQFDQPKADLVWHPLDDVKHNDQYLEGLMSMSCSSVLSGGGTNQELVFHCLHECGGNILEALERLMLQDSIFPSGHHLGGYHYSGSDSWTAEEKCYFNKGIGAYRKDFFLVQKLVRSKTVAQCVEFYYTYKKQVKVGRNGILTFGPPDSLVEKHTEMTVDIKTYQPKLTPLEVDEDNNKKEFYDESHESSQQARVVQSLQAHDYAGTVLVIKEPDVVKKEPHPPSGFPRPRAEPAAKKGKAPPKPPQDPDAVFPCKKCGRVFYKVKSRSAHMKSHAEQEKKAAALRQKEEEERAAAQARARKAAAALAVASHQGGNGNGAAQQAELSSQEDSTEVEDDDDEDWH
ncbi:mitotic deacetylase associated SANT domain protein a isoform X2 [Nematolebias whitei]|uniref:mitotic deacetylase associated SANT domain protein a isoform X2 n=1 Tax=Nematolebias whitei TaxID=451745 RepID=UPI001897F5B8|nr:mitotic deacetylase associated SANT domain protein a isoform X2 [Nematolebias whitei]